MQYFSSDDLNKSTASIYVTGKNENFVASGFFFYFSNNNSVFLVTNRHVAEDAKSFTISLHSSLHESCYAFIENIPEKVIYHPQIDADLCIVKMSDLQLVPPNMALEMFQFKPLMESMIISEKELCKLNYCEDVLMFGSPDGLYDAKNNLSIAYKGMTATHPGINFYDLEQFYINISSFPGSSGSAVFLCRPETMTNFSNTKLLGIHTKSHYMQKWEYDKIYMNLGLVIPAYKLLDFKSII